MSDGWGNWVAKSIRWEKSIIDLKKNGFIVNTGGHYARPVFWDFTLFIDATEKNGHGENTTEHLLSNPIKERNPKFDVVKIDFGAFVVGLLLFLFFNLGYWLLFSLYNFN